MLRTAALKVLGAEDLPAARELVARDPVANVFVASRLEVAGADPWRLGGELWGWYEGADLVSLCYVGANLIPVEATPAALAAFADRARRHGRHCSSLVGPRDQVLALWALLEVEWGPARSVRADQPLLVSTAPSSVPGDPRVRRVTEAELDLLVPACIAMFTEEVGVSPLVGDGGRLYRNRVAELVRSGRALARIDDGEVVFKAELGVVSSQACQVQGVWVHPSLRGTGLAAPGMAAVVDLALREVAPVVSLYVNDYNRPARAAYARIGMTQVGTFASILF